jgi:hypothetical protein
MANKINITIDQGTTFSHSFPPFEDAQGNVVDLTTYTGTSYMRKNPASSQFFPFSVNLANTGVITLGMPATNTSRLAAGRYLYDVRLVSNTNIVTRAFEGIVTVTPNVTR